MMPTTQPRDLLEDEAPLPNYTGNTALVLGVVAVMMLGCPWLPDPVPAWMRYFPLYLVLATGICAALAGAITLRSMRGQADADRRRAQAGILFGSIAIIVPLAVIAWACWQLRDI
ncbi:hypothetical protein [Streptomyces melanosporofaciens]|uniref:Uncharacterized protein n=1 Tax=Streptomyces melanosporofaciens TaxID=67327 RepID=A0A1H5AT02_STRMJ|nr:hypothetical protein [Streptomyces melanosporofaciens]SED45559.1 hypothetical protein SAMN04490356_8522 [Streptomyces melanosporofaciens]